eukprot:Hpha_TRINITY_DN16241_c7_g6::TRINITY_DN16241_c7_g6_i1::g.12267::m.12267/K07359/CAMKK2; calcium/calmodulin-dependent protein kinase kinase 2
MGCIAGKSEADKKESKSKDKYETKADNGQKSDAGKPSESSPAQAKEVWTEDQSNKREVKEQSSPSPAPEPEEKPPDPPPPLPPVPPAPPPGTNSAETKETVGAAPPPEEAPANGDGCLVPVLPPLDTRGSNVGLDQCGELSHSSSLRRSAFRDVNFVKEKTDAQGRQCFNEYTCESHLGSGRFGDVFLVRRDVPDPGPDEPELYAMKVVMKKAMAKDKQNKEVEILKRIDHPNVVRLHEVMNDPSRTEMFMIFEFVDGGPILELGDDGRADEVLEEAKLRKYMKQIVDGLQYLHDLNIIHRDIKPENILVTKHDIIKIADLGVSRLLNTEDDGSRDTGGTPLFLSPEACRGEFASGKSNDVWALGVTLYILMYGVAPFTEVRNEILLYGCILDQEIEYPNDPPHDPELLSVLKRMLERNSVMRITLNEVRNNPWIRGSEELAQIHALGATEQRSLSIDPVDLNQELVCVSSPEMQDKRGGGGIDINILIVEDVFLVQKVTSKMLHAILDAKLEVKCVSDGEDAVEACKTTRFHLALMDVHMSRVSGITATSRIREYEKAEGLVATNILGLTADPHEEMIRLCLGAGMQQVVQKPLQPAKLRELCEQLGLPVKQGEASFSATTAFQKGEVKGGAKKNAFLKSYEEHLQKTAPQSPRSQSQSSERRTSASPTAPQKTPQRQGTDPSSEKALTPEKAKSRASTAGQELNTLDAGEIMDTTSTGAASKEEEGQTPKDDEDGNKEGPSMPGAFSSDDMRSRSLMCMKQHANMYKKKDCEAIFAMLDDKEVNGFSGMVLQDLYDAVGWDKVGALSVDVHKSTRDFLTEHLEDWAEELRIVNGGAVPWTDLLQKAKETDWWETTSNPEALTGEVDLAPQFQVVAFADKGQRGSMEDRHSVLLYPTCMFKPRAKALKNEVLVGVYDGHGGPEAADYCRRTLLTRIACSKEFGNNPVAGMRAAFNETNKAFFKRVDGGDCDAGTTAIAVLARDKKLHVANVGDCRAVLGTGGGCKQLNRIHVCADEEERKAVEARGGEVIHYCGSWRVNGVLLVTRTIGDHPCKDVVTSDPETYTFDITPEDEFVVIASDGIWDVLTPEEVCDNVRGARAEIKEALEAQKDGPSEPAEPKGEGEEEEEEEEDDELGYAVIPEAIVSEAIDRGSGDNITCVVIFINN